MRARDRWGPQPSIGSFTIGVSATSLADGQCRVKSRCSLTEPVRELRFVEKNAHRQKDFESEPPGLLMS